MTPLQRFAEDNNISVQAAHTIVRYANNLAKLGEQECNEGSAVVGHKLHAAHVKFFNYIRKQGFEGYGMPGLYPILNKGGKFIHLPD